MNNFSGDFFGYTKSVNHDYCVDVESFNIDNVSFYTGNNFSYGNVYVRYRYDDGKIRNLQLKTDFYPVTQNPLLQPSQYSVCIYVKHALYLSTLMNSIETKFTEHCLLEQNKEHNKIKNLDINSFIKSSGDYKRFVIVLNDDTKIVNYNVSKKYKPSEEITDINIDVLKRIFPKQNGAKNSNLKKEGAFILKPYFCCVPVNGTKNRSCYGKICAHTAEIKYNGANINSVVEYKTCKPYKIPKNAHLNISI